MQHKLLICVIQLKTLKYKPNPFVPKLRYCKLSNAEVGEDFERAFTEKINVIDNDNTEDIWKLSKSTLLISTEEICGNTKKGHQKRVTWWLTNEISAVIEKKAMLEVMETGW